MGDRLRNIHGKDTEGTEISAEGLLNMPVPIEYEEKINKLRKKEKTSVIILAIMLVVTLLIFSPLALHIVISGRYELKDSIFGLLICILSIYLAIKALPNSIKGIGHILDKDYTKVQHGKVVTKYVMKDISGETERTRYKYYANVVFKDTNTFIRKVKINNTKDYESINEGDEVLVVTYDGNLAIIVRK